MPVQNLQADYSMESHALDLENYVNVARNRRRRAKALLDFERHDDDELGFRKNDIITVSLTDHRLVRTRRLITAVPVSFSCNVDKKGLYHSILIDLRRP